MSYVGVMLLLSKKSKDRLLIVYVFGVCSGEFESNIPAVRQRVLAQSLNNLLVIRAGEIYPSSWSFASQTVALLPAPSLYTIS